jgi:hypothetical protein
MPQKKYEEDGRYFAEVNVVRVDKATFAKVSFCDDNLTREYRNAAGLSLRGPDDKDDAETAHKLALGRAFVALGNKLLHEANGLVKHHDNMKKQKARQLEKPWVIPALKAAAVRVEKDPKFTMVEVAETPKPAHKSTKLSER